MEVSKSSLMLKKNASVPSASSEKCGNFFVGCKRPKIGKKFPSSAAEYGTREYPSNTENTDATAIHNTIPVATDAAVCPYSRSTKVLTMNFEFCASRHGITPKMLVCMALYSAVMPRTYRK